MEVTDIFSLGELFNAVQLMPVFSDGKTFVDCTPRADLSFILQRYDEEKKAPGFDLPAFVHENFTEPGKLTENYKSEADRPISEHLELLWDELTRQPETIKIH